MNNYKNKYIKYKLKYLKKIKTNRWVMFWTHMSV